jgi:hypothetical protein
MNQKTHIIKHFFAEILTIKLQLIRCGATE